jgi:RHS repeat-associated protein
MNLVESGFYYLSDGQGSIRLLRNSVSQLKASYSYDAYGSQHCTMPGGPTECDANTPFGYTGQYQDQESGLLYLRARYYDPATQQFISRDPLEQKTGQPYTYAYGNPVNYVDPAGLEGENSAQQLWLPKFNRNAPNGSIDYGGFDKHNRPTGIRAVLTRALLGRKLGTRVTGKFNPPGWVEGATNRGRGHLLGKQLGGSGSDPRNIVTIVQEPVNNSLMKRSENAVRRAVESGETVSYSVAPIYRGTEGMPAGFRIRAQGSGGFFLNRLIANKDPGP